MKNRNQIIIGSVLIVLGLAYAAATLLDIELSGAFWPLLLILLGVWMLLRPRLANNSGDEYHLLGDVVRTGRWKVENEEHWMLIGDVKLDLTGAELPEGETVIRFNALIGDMKVIAPIDLPLYVSATGVLSEVKLFGQKQDGFLSPIEMQTPAYRAASRRLRLESSTFIGGLKVREG
jgi:hypothetical protein